MRPTARGVRHHVRRGTQAAQEKYSGSSAEHLWSRLDSMDFINRGMLFAATLLLCFFPFLIIANALAGRSAASGLARHLGLNKQAAADLSHLFTSSTATSNAVTGTAWVWFLLGGDCGSHGHSTVVRAGLRSRIAGHEGRGAAVALAGCPGRRIASDRLGGTRRSPRRWAGPARGSRPGGVDGLLVVHHVVPAGRKDVVARPFPGGLGHRGLLDRDGSGLFDHLLQHRHFR